MTMMMTTRPRVDATRLEAFLGIYGLTRVDLSKAVGFDRSYVSKVLGGKLRPSSAFLAALAGALERIAKERRIDSAFFVVDAR